MINIIGSIFGVSGYDSHCRQLANALSKITDVRLTVGQVPQGAELGMTDRELSMVKKRPEKDEINLIVTVPTHWTLNLTAKRNWVFLVWEGDRVPDHFIKLADDPRIEKILVPSTHTLHAALETIKDLKLNPVADKLVLAPHGVDHDIFFPEQYEKTSPFVFCANKGFRNMEDRGGVQYLLQAFTEEFTEKDDVELRLKVNPAYGIPDMQNVIAQIAGGRKIAPIKIDVGAYMFKDMARVYRGGNVFVSPTRAEAFNLPCLEAMACGLPVITTDFGGQAEYVDNENGWIVDGELKNVEHEIQYEGIKWMTPDINQLRKAMREAYELEESTLKVKSKKAANKASEYTWAKTAEIIKDLI